MAAQTKHEGKMETPTSEEALITAYSGARSANGPRPRAGGMAITSRRARLRDVSVLARAIEDGV
jgi:hypothetical protein